MYGALDRSRRRELGAAADGHPRVQKQSHGLVLDRHWKLPDDRPRAATMSVCPGAKYESSESDTASRPDPGNQRWH